MECYVTKTYLKVLSRGRPTLSFLEKYDFVILCSSIEDIYILSLFFLYFFFLKLIRKEDVRGLLIAVFDLQRCAFSLLLQLNILDGRNLLFFFISLSILLDHNKRQTAIGYKFPFGYMRYR